MTDKVIPSVQGDSDAFVVAQLIELGAGSSGWIQPSSSALLADNVSSLDQTAVPLNAFNESHSSSSYDVTIDTGEGFVGGAWVARDVTTTVTLSSSTNNQTVYAGWDISATDTLIIGKSGAFASEDQKIPIWEFDTDGSGVTNADDKRQLGQSSDLGQVTIDADSEIARYLATAVSSSPNGTAGNSNNEVLRIPGTSSDLIQSVQDGSGKLNIAYNTYFDGTDWRYMVGTEPAMRLEFAAGIKLHHATGGTAGNIITFDTFHFDDGTGDILFNGSTWYDGANNNILQGSLEGPASSLSSYPLPAGDISDGSGSNLDADLVDGKHASEIGGGDWTVIDTYSDTDGTTTFDYSTGTLTTTYDLYRVEGVFHGHQGGGNPNELRCRVNGESTSNYNYTSIDASSGIMRKEDENSWGDIAKNEASDGTGDVYSSEGHAELVFRGNQIPGAETGENYPTISGTSTGWHNHPQLTNGWLDANYATVDTIRLFSDRVMTGGLKVLGKTIV